MPKAHRPAPRAPAAPKENEAASKPALPLALLALSLVGAAVAADLWVVHHEVHSGAASVFCDFSARVSCSDVARSRYSTLFGVPLAAFGLVAYLSFAALSALGLVRGKKVPSFPGGILTVLSFGMSLLAVVLALISELKIHAICIMCSISWAISFALLALSLLLAKRGGGVVPALLADLGTVKTRPKESGLFGLALAAALIGLVLSSALVKEAPARKPLAFPPISIPIGPPGSLVVYEFSDYLCPYCARVHAEEKVALSRRPDLRIVKRQFPLDASCNTRLTRTLHEGSCDLARGGICAEKLGRLGAYEDAAFASQESNPGVFALAAQCGLDESAFKACLASPETESRLKADIQDGIAAGVAGTPSYQFQGKLLKGSLPPELGGPAILH